MALKLLSKMFMVTVVNLHIYSTFLFPNLDSWTVHVRIWLTKLLSSNLDG